MNPTDTPHLDCPNCGEPLFPATGRGLWNEETEEFNEHREACGCDQCDWVWHEDEEATCECGARCIVDVDEDRAWVREVME